MNIVHNLVKNWVMEKVVVAKKTTKFKNFLSNAIKNFSLAHIFDWLFLNLCIFLFLFAWIRFVSKSFAAAATITTVILIVANVAKFCFFPQKKPEKSQKQLGKLSSDFFVNYMSLNAKERAALVGNSFGKRVKNGLYLSENRLVLVALEQKPLDIAMALNCAKFAVKNEVATLVVLCQAGLKDDINLLQSIKNVKIEILCGSEAYEYFCKHSSPPQTCLVTGQRSKITFKDLANEAVEPSKAKKYFLSGLLVFFCSLVVRYNIYYVLMSSAMFFLSLMCLANKKRTFKKSF